MKGFDAKRLGSLGATLVVASLGGFLADLAGLPVSWLLGPVLAVSLASLTGLDTRQPVPLRTIAFFVLGIQAGSGVNAATIEQVALWPASFAIQMAGVFLTVVVTRRMLMKGFGWQGDTALFASLPGALAFVVAAAEETRADIRQVTVVQSMRLVFLIGAIVPLLALLQGGEGVSLATRGQGGTLGEYALLLGVCAVTGMAGRFLKVPGGMMLGALVGSAVLHAGGVVGVSVPPVLAIPALVLLGAIVGERLHGITVKDFVALLPAALASFAIGIALAILMGALAVLVLGVTVAKVALAYAPGALEALTVLAFQFDVDPAFVAAHHVVRFIAIAFAVPFIARRLDREP